MRLRQASKVEIALLTGGDPPKSDLCEAYAPLGFLGFETQAVETIAKFINVAVLTKSSARLNLPRLL